jgi:hypothetical protein
MDIVTLVQQITPWLISAAPYLWKIGESTGKDTIEEVRRAAVSKLGSALWEEASTVWDKTLHSKSGTKEDVVRVVKDAAALPDDPKTQAVLRESLKILLASDPNLKDEIVSIVRNASLSASTDQIRGDRNAYIDGGAMNNTIITGNDNIVGSHNTDHRKKP